MYFKCNMGFEGPYSSVGEGLVLGPVGLRRLLQYIGHHSSYDGVRGGAVVVALRYKLKVAGSIPDGVAGFFH
jgi:hypothetical protein